jgi:hypothetical protein
MSQSKSGPIDNAWEDKYKPIFHSVLVVYLLDQLVFVYFRVYTSFIGDKNNFPGNTFELRVQFKLSLAVFTKFVTICLNKKSNINGTSAS